MIDSQFLKSDPNNDLFKHLNETRKWTLFLSICGFIFLGIMAIAFPLTSIRANNSFPTAGAIGALVPALIIVAIYFFPIFFLFQFSRFSKLAIEQNDTNLLIIAFKFLKRHYKYMGILFIIILSIYVVIGIIAIINKSWF